MNERLERIGDSRNKACRAARRERVFARSGAKYQRRKRPTYGSSNYKP